MRKLLGVALVVCMMCMPVGFALAESLDFSGYTDEVIVELLTQIQEEIVARNIEKTAVLQMGTYVGGKNIPVGSYTLVGAGKASEFGIISLGPVDDEDTYPSKLYEFFHHGNDCSVFIFVEEGDVLELPFPCNLTISNIVFQ